MIYNKEVEQWGILEIELKSEKTYKKPFSDVEIWAYFKKSGDLKKVYGFYDGDSVWKIRFMPQDIGEYSFSIESNASEFNGLNGKFMSMQPASNNHGPVKVVNTYHFSHADNTPFFVMGTTAYAWTYRPKEVREQTLKSFTKNGFNKIRMLVFPKHYTGQYSGLNVSYEPPVYPFDGTPGAFDFQSPNPEYFKNFEDRVKDLLDRGIQADVILFHPYDSGQWGIDKGMTREDDLIYLKYIIARLAAYRNVWWSLANEYNFFRKDWDLIGSFIKTYDPYNHLISNHNIPFGDVFPNREWLSHVSYQHPDTYTFLLELKNKYKKPVINDEYQYEGNVQDDWGNSSAETTLMRHWLSVMAGGYGTHGEVFVIDGNKKDLFWSYGGTMVGESAPRLRYMKQIVETCPFQEMKRDPINTDGHNWFSLSKDKDFYLMFFRYDQPGKVVWFGLDNDSYYNTTVYDVWNCKEKSRFVMKKNTDIKITEWTVVKLERI